MITTSAMISELYTKKIIGKKRPKKINVNKSVQKAVKKYRFKKWSLYCESLNMLENA